MEIMKQEYKDKIDDWMANRTQEELEYALDAATKEFLKRADVLKQIEQQAKGKIKRLLLQEDECAPDAKEYFRVNFLELMNMTIDNFIKQSTMSDLGDVFVYNLGDTYELRNEIGIYSLYKFEQQKSINFGVVVFYEPNYKDKTIVEINRTKLMSYSDALYIYSETPNPASQLVKGETETEVEEGLKLLEQNIQNKDWLEQLFEAI